MATSYNGKIATTVINRFNGGIANDPRDSRDDVCRMVTNFDIFTNPRKMTPYRSSEDGDSASGTSQKQNFVIALRTGTTYSLYGYGRQSASNKAEISYKDLTTGGTGDLDDDGWNSPSNHQATQATPNYNLFIYYKKTGLIYGAHSGTHIWAFDPSGTAAFADTHLALTYTNIAQGLIHSKDDILYVPYDNKIAKNDNGVWTVDALTLPNNFFITSICEMGNNIAIAMSPLSGAAFGRSVVYIWDRNTSITTLSETIPWDEGQLQILEVIEGYLIGISKSGNSVTRHQNRVIFRYLTGNNFLGYRAEKIMELVAPTGQESSPPGSMGSFVLPIAKQIIEGRLHFLMQIYINGEQRDGVWSFGKIGDKWVLNHERTANNDTALTSATLYNFIYVGDYLFISYDD